MKPNNPLSRRLFPTALLLSGLLWAAAATALESDRNEPIQIEADKATIDDQGNSIYEGNVYLHQGTLQLRGSRMSLTLNNKRIERITLDGSPATFSQRPDGADTDQQADAGHIEYLTASQHLLLQGNAVVRQSGREEFRSERIEVNLRDNTVEAGGAGTGNRVHITLQPEKPATRAPDATQEQPATKSLDSTPDQPATKPLDSTPDQPATKSPDSIPEQPATKAPGGAPG
jgi:lipopolysaccharide export system protein LptA